MRALSLRLSLELPSMKSVEARNTRLPLAATDSDAPPLKVRLATVALPVRLTDLPEIVTRSLTAGAPLGVQFAAVAQFPPLGGPIQVFVAQFPSLSETATRALM